MPSWDSASIKLEREITVVVDDLNARRRYFTVLSQNHRTSHPKTFRSFRSCIQLRCLFLFPAAHFRFEIKRSVVRFLAECMKMDQCTSLLFVRPFPSCLILSYSIPSSSTVPNHLTPIHAQRYFGMLWHPPLLFKPLLRYIDVPFIQIQLTNFNFQASPTALWNSYLPAVAYTTYTRSWPNFPPVQKPHPASSLP